MKRAFVLLLILGFISVSASAKNELKAKSTMTYDCTKLLAELPDHFPTSRYLRRPVCQVAGANLGPEDFQVLWSEASYEAKCWRGDGQPAFDCECSSEARVDRFFALLQSTSETQQDGETGIYGACLEKLSLGEWPPSIDPSCEMFYPEWCQAELTMALKP